MAMRIFNADETIFTSNGLKSLQPIYCHEIRNESEWYLDVRVPLSFLEYTIQDNIIVVETLDKGEQAFRVRNITVGQDIKFEAWHIGYDSRVFTVELSTFVNLNPTQALTQLLTDTQTNNFTVFSDIATQLSFSIIDVPLYDALIDMAERYNAVLEFDNWQIRLVSSIGSDKGVTVAYGKNLESSSFEENWDMVVTELYPKGNNGLVGTTLYSSIVYDRPYAKIVSFDTDDLTTLNNLASAYLSRFEKPRVNYKVKASNLSYLENVTGHNALSYFSHLFLENYDHNELSDFKYPTLVGLGDTIKVIAKQFELFTDVLSYKFNVITRKMIELEFGNYRPTIRNAIGQLRAEITEQADRKAQIKIDEVNGEIDLRVKQDEIISSINLSPELIKIIASKIQLEGLVTINDGFEVLLDGSIIVNNGTFKGSIDTAENIKIGENMRIPIYEPPGITELIQVINNGRMGIQFGELQTGDLYKAFITAVNMKTISGSSEDEIRLRIRASENIELVAGSIISVNRGIQFPSTKVPSSNANTLDDYEEGTWTPVLSGLTTAGVGTYSVQEGKYTKVGNKVSFGIRLIWSAHSGTGGMIVSLPFTSGAGTFNPCTIIASNLTFSNQLSAMIGGNEDRVVIYQFGSGGALTVVNMDTSATLYISGTYMV